MNTSPPFSVRKILVRVNNWIGDVVMISPAMRAVRTAFPRAEITLLAKTWVLDALRDSPICDRLIEYDREGRHAGWGGRCGLLLQLRRERFDLALLFQKAFEAALFARLSGIPWRVGFRTDCRSWLLSTPLALPDGIHHVEQFLRIAEAVGASMDDRRLSFHVTPAARDASLRFLREWGLESAPLRVAIHPGASKAPRSWHPARFGAVGRTLVNEYDVRPLLLGTKQDAPALDVIRSLAGPACITPPAEQNLQEMAALLERCHLLLCNDSGPMHVAAALGVPVVAIFGPGSPERTGPWMNPSLYRILTHQYPCSPCRQRFFEECRPAPSGKPLCLDDVSPEEAVQACRELLRSAAAAGPSNVAAPARTSFETGRTPSAP